jgi:uncharacterized protein (TIGR03663 family)
MAVIDRPLGSAVVQTDDIRGQEQFWQRPFSALLTLDREMVAFLALTLIAGVLRFWDLGSRMMHHDESLHAVYSYYLYIGKGYVHDPMMHGPFLFELNALVYFLLGATDATARVAPALFGTVLVGLPYFLRDRLGRTGAIVTAALLAISPSILYYSRFIRHDVYQIFFMMLLVIAVFRYMSDRTNVWLYVAAVTTSLAFADKEDSYFLLAIVLIFLLALSYRDAFDVIIYRRPAAHPATDMLVLLGTLILPLFSAVPYFVVKNLPQQSIDLVFAVTFAILFAIGAIIGIRWNRQVWIRSAIAFWVIMMLLYTTFLSNPNGVTSGVFGSLRYWIDQQTVARGGQPTYYYLILLPLYEFLTVGIGLASVPHWLRNRSVFTTFLMYWCVTSLVLWGWASEKMPWMVVEMALPFAILAGVTVGKLIDITDWRKLVREGGLQLGLCAALAFLTAATLLSIGSPLAESSSLSTQRALFQWVAIAAVFVGLVYGTTHYWMRLGSKLSLKILAFTAIVLVTPFTVRAAWQANYFHGDIPVEMLVYTQSSPDVGLVMKQIDDMSYRAGQGKAKFPVAYDSGVSWPFEWYLRDYTARSFMGTGNPPANAPVVLTGMENGRDTQMKQQLGSKYVSQRYRLRWWFPEDTTYRNLSFGGIVQGLLDSKNRNKLWRYLIYRETPSDLGSTDFIMFVRRDLAYGPWAAPQAEAQTADEAAYTQKVKNVAATTVFGVAGAADGQFQQPKGIALGPDGNLYVADSQNHRIEVVTPAGKFVRAWGTKGTDPGQFNEPWGVAVSAQGNVYVADTWNHRVQEFTTDGKFVRAWGSQPVGEPQSGDGQFFGPRAIAIDGQGNVYVTDTGNKRIQKFTSDGTFVASIGGPGAGAGFFNEPVGLAFDQTGNLFVADAWNQRVQKFGPDLKPLSSFPVAAWDSQTVVDKPFLAVDNAGNVYVSDPQNGRVIQFNASGQLMALWGKPGNDTSSFKLPTGLAVDDTGSVFVSDSDNDRIMKFAPIK